MSYDRERFDRTSPAGLPLPIHYGARSGIVTDGVLPEALDRFGRLAVILPGVSIVSALRRRDLQERMYAEYRAGKRRAPVGNPDRRWRNGRRGSEHMPQPDGHSYALDVAIGFHDGSRPAGVTWQMVHRAAEFCGLGFRLSSECWHSSPSHPSHRKWRTWPDAGDPPGNAGRSDYRRLIVDHSAGLWARTEAWHAANDSDADILDLFRLFAWHTIFGAAPAPAPEPAETPPPAPAPAQPIKDATPEPWTGELPAWTSLASKNYARDRVTVARVELLRPHAQAALDQRGIGDQIDLALVNAACESSGRLTARRPGGSELGPWQFTERTWRWLTDRPLDDRADPAAAAEVMADLVSRRGWRDWEGGTLPDGTIWGSGPKGHGCWQFPPTAPTPAPEPAETPAAPVPAAADAWLTGEPGSYLDEYETAVAAGLTDGARPNDPITRQETAVMILRGLRRLARR